MVSCLTALISADFQNVTSASEKAELISYEEVTNSLSKATGDAPKETFFEYCTRKDIINYHDFVAGQKDYGDSTSAIPGSRFDEYIKSRGCKSLKELQCLSITGLKNLKELQTKVCGLLSTKLNSLHINLSNEEIKYLVSKTNLEYLANYYTKTTSAPKYSGTKRETKEMSALINLFENFLQIKNLGTKLRYKIKEILKPLNAYLNTLNAQLRAEELEKTERTKAKIEAEETKKETDAEDNTEENISTENTYVNSTYEMEDSTKNNEENLTSEKYNALLIANYQI